MKQIYQTYVWAQLVEHWAFKSVFARHTTFPIDSNIAFSVSYVTEYLFNYNHSQLL